LRIPRILHQTWKSHELPEPFRSYQAKWRALHPHYEYRLYSDADNDALVRREFPQYYELYRAFPREIYRADLARCLYLLRDGGVYVDLDVEPLKPLDALLERSGECLLGAEPEAHARKRRGKRVMACNAVMASVPGHPFWQRMLDEISERAAGPARHDPVAVTGPIALDAAYERYGSALGVSVSDPDTFFPLPDIHAQKLPISARERRHFERMLELGLYPRGSYAVHHWAHTWIKNRKLDRIIERSRNLSRRAFELARARATADELLRPERYGVHFPEHAFPPRAERAATYRERVEQGRARARRGSLCVLVLLHDRIDLALLLRARLERWAELFGRPRVLILCEDSTDGTASVIRDWCAERPELVRSVTPPSDLESMHGFGRMSRLRNTLLAESESEATELVAVLDGDLEGPVSLDGLLHALSLLAEPGAPDAVSAFGLNNWGGVPAQVPFIGYSYYDPIAFRERTWERRERDARIRLRLASLRRGDPALPVNSAFAGLTLYRASLLRGLRYDEQTRDCEHVSLHREFARRGGRLVIDPALLLLAGRQGHHAED
jgi:hypothetical protein